MEDDNPVWLDKDFLNSVLQEDHKGDIEIIEFTTRPAVGPGNNYTSYIYRVKVIYKSKTVHQNQFTALIVKKPIETGMINEIFGNSNFLEKEPNVYGVLLPNMYKKFNFQFGPKSYISPIKNVIIMEDLSEEGYATSKDKNQLDYNHCKTVVETLAKFHATSISYYHDDPKFVAESVGKDKLWADGTPVEQMVNNGIKRAVVVIKEMSCDRRFEEFLLNRADHIWDSIKSSSKPKPLGLNVLNHGDLWLNNVMFKHDDSHNITGIKFVDFQITKFASPATDLIYFIWTSANDEVREKYQNDLYQVYRRVLNNTLEQLGCEERLSQEELSKDLKECADWALLVICSFLPVMMSAPEDAVDFGSFTKEDFESSKFLNLYKGKVYRSLLPKLTKHFSEFFLSNQTLIKI